MLSLSLPTLGRVAPYKGGPKFWFRSWTFVRQPPTPKVCWLLNPFPIGVQGKIAEKCDLHAAVHIKVWRNELIMQLHDKK